MVQYSSEADGGPNRRPLFTWTIPLSQRENARNKDRYQYFNPKLRDEYKHGDIYNRNQGAYLKTQAWKKTNEALFPGPYQKYVKDLLTKWPHLNSLLDFMEVGTSPLRWENMAKELPPTEGQAQQEQQPGNGEAAPATDPQTPPKRGSRAERIIRENARRIDYIIEDQKVVVEPEPLNIPGESQELPERLKRYGTRNIVFRLWVVEDLSRHMVESFGSEFQLDPTFFREHVYDNVWFNVRDPFTYVPKFQTIVRDQQWLQLRYVRARYFRDWKAFEAANKEATDFNVSRRAEDDLSNNSGWDDPNAMVGLIRTKATLWLGNHTVGGKKRAVGILLLDPTIGGGTPLWCGYRNWEPIPGLHPTESPETSADSPPQTSVMDDFMHWAQKPSVFTQQNSTDAGAVIRPPVLALLHLVCADWYTLLEYIRTRLSHIEWEVTSPEGFFARNIDNATLDKLHHWRRVAWNYREFLADAVKGIENFSKHIDQIATEVNQSTPVRNEAADTKNPIDDFRTNFESAFKSIEDHITNIERLRSITTSMISTEFSRREKERSRYLRRLGFLGSVLAPLGFISSISGFKGFQPLEAYRSYILVASPVVLIILFIAFRSMIFARVRTWWRTWHKVDR